MKPRPQTQADFLARFGTKPATYEALFAATDKLTEALNVQYDRTAALERRVAGLTREIEALIASSYVGTR